MSLPILECIGVDKRFGATTVLKGVSLTVHAGQVLALVGENGAGKSTLTNILGGVVEADAGELRLGGAPFRAASPADATAQGVSIVHQELNLFPNLSIAENLFLTEFPGSAFAIDRKRLHTRAAQVLGEVGLHRNPGMLVETLGPGERQLVEIARAIAGRARVIIFDEPTTSLTETESRRLFDIIRDLKQRGLGVIYISHNLPSVYRVADDIAVLRDGAIQAIGPGRGFTEADLIRHMVGRELSHLFPENSELPSGGVALRVERLTRKPAFEDVSFSLQRGEILGLAGLMGAGRTELARAIFGLDALDHGTIEVSGRTLRPSPVRSIHGGVAFLTEDRRYDGLLLDANIDDNVGLARLRTFSRLGLSLRRQLSNAVAGVVASAGIQGSTRRLVKVLSGGNQQKVVLAKWLLCRPKVLILDEPTRGVDVGARSEIYQTIRQLAAEGMSVLLISSEIEELVGLSHRILVMSAGRIAAELPRRPFDREEILRHALGRESAA
jgi:ribose transport system ATP-binding protein